jgi:lipopolysaccharide export system protein LptC
MSISSPTPEEFSRPARFSRAIAQVRRRSRLILLLRRALPAAIAAVFAVLIGWVLVRSVLTALSDLTRAATVIHMTNPHFYGQDDHGRDFVVSASEAQRSLRLAGVIRLTNPDLKLAGADGRSFAVAARQGIYEETTHRITLQGDVRVATGDGTTFRTQQALIDMRAGTVSGNSPVQGTGPLGQINASSYAIYDRGAQAVFTGQVHAHLVQRR